MVADIQPGVFLGLNASFPTFKKMKRGALGCYGGCVVQMFTQTYCLLWKINGGVADGVGAKCATPAFSFVKCCSMLGVLVCDIRCYIPFLRFVLMSCCSCCDGVLCERVPPTRSGWLLTKSFQEALPFCSFCGRVLCR